jgi:hypothetical protein
VVSLNGQVIAAPAGSADWVDDEHIVYQLCDHTGCHVDTYNQTTAEVDIVLYHGANTIEAGGGVWAAWFGTLDPVTAGITTSDGGRFPSSGLGPVGPDGAIAIKVAYQSAGPWDVLERDGTRWALTAGDAGNINLLGQRRAVWSEAGGVVAAQGVIVPTVLTRPFYWLRVLDVGGDWWVLYQDSIGRLVLHPSDSSKGYVITQGNAFRPDAVQMPDGRIRVVWALSEGEPPADIRTHDVRLTDARIELRPEAPVPGPTFPTLGRFWLGPNIGSVDQLQMFDDVANLRGVDTFTIYIQEIIADTSTPQLGTNIYPNLVAHDVFRKLENAGIPLVIEMGSVKPSDCDAANAIRGMPSVVQRVADAGGTVAAIAMDEPLTSNQEACGGNLTRAADAVSTFIQAVHALGPIAVGWIEAWPEVGFNTMRLFLMELRNRNTLPAFLHTDIDWARAKREAKDPVAFIGAAQGLANEFGLTLGLYVNATKDPIATDTEHYQNLDALAKRIESIAPDAAHVVTCSWAHRTSPDPTHATQNVPNNLGPDGLLASLSNTRTVFAAPAPEPEPPPVELTDMMAYSAPILGFQPGQLEPHPDGNGALLIRKHNGKVVCVTPDGNLEERDHAGPWEKFTKAKNGASLIAEREGNRIYVLSIAE